MKLRGHIYELINTSKIRLMLALELGVSEMTIRNYINDHSNQLTLAAALKIIEAETGLTRDDILIDETLGLELSNS